MKKIDRLTKKQEAQIPSHVQKWIDIGLKTGDADFETFDKYMPVCYKKAGLKYPKNIVRVKSPLAGALSAAIAESILKDGAVGGSVRDAVLGAVGVAVRDAVDGAVGGSVRDAVGVAVDSAVRDAVYSAVLGAVNNAVDGAVDRAVDRAVGDAVDGAVDRAVDRAVGDAVGVAVRDAVGDAVRDAVGDAVLGAVRDAVYSAVLGAVNNAVGGAVKKLKIEWHNWFGGQFWVGGWWGSPSVVSFFTEVCSLELSDDIMERLTAYKKVCESVNYIWTNKNFVIVCDRPKEINRDDQGRLHNESGMSISYKDGWGLYSIHGVTVNEQIVMRPETLTLDQIEKEINLEKQRIMIERFGIYKYLLETGAKLIDSDMRGIEGGGARALFLDKANRRWLCATDGSTERVYYMAVSEDAKTCREAHEILCGFSETKIKMEG